MNYEVSTGGYFSYLGTRNKKDINRCKHENVDKYASGGLEKQGRNTLRWGIGIHDGHRLSYIKELKKLEAWDQSQSL